MDAIGAELLESGKRGARGRQVLPEEEWERLLDDYEKSGLTQAAFARREGINLHTLVGRLGRRRMRRREAVVAPAGIRFKELSLRSGSASVLEVHLDRKSTRLNSSHVKSSYAVFRLKKKIS